MTEPDTAPPERRSLWRLAILLYPFASTAMAINLFLAALMLRAIGLQALSPVAALVLGLITGIPATWLAARWVRSLLEQAE